MKKLIRKFWKDEAGFIISMELVLIATILVIGLVGGLVSLRDQLNAELADVGGAIGGLDQTFQVSGETASTDGSGTVLMGWTDSADTYDVASGGPSDAGGTGGLTVAVAAPAASSEGTGT